MSTEETNTQQEQRVPTKEEMIAHINEQIEIMEPRVKLQELRAAFAMAQAEELKAVAFMSQLTQAPQEDTTLTDQEESPSEKKLKRG